MCTYFALLCIRFNCDKMTKNCHFWQEIDSLGRKYFPVHFPEETISFFAQTQRTERKDFRLHCGKKAITHWGKKSYYNDFLYMDGVKLYGSVSV
jgi:hypothetical protein